VTGGAGYIGSVAVERLIEAGEDVVVLDNLETGYRGAVAPEAVFVEGDILDRAQLDRLFGQFDIDTVMHFAAFIVVSESCADPGKYFRNNVGGALSVLDAMVAGGVGRFILSSTAAVYGEPEAVPITEDMRTRPKNPYGLSKHMIEQALGWYERAHGLRSVSLRYFNAAGATERHGEAHVPETHLIPNVLMAADRERERVTVYGNDYDTPDGTCIRDYVHVVDLADAHLLAMRYLRGSGASETVNLGNSVGNSVIEVIRAVERVAGCAVPVVYGQRRAGDAARLVAASDKARRLLGWRPERDDIDTIVRDAWNWRKAHARAYA